MLDQVLLAASEAEASHGGVHPAVIGIGAFIILMSLLGITYLFSGLRQQPSEGRRTVAELERTHREHQRRRR
ncbi:hypothetical protein M3A96_03940 [Helcobacillus massiliensis]|uniref:Uncharacterized protein n=1 Tax=Helcobacillus massiliensis TaxID=521392 RepID=A0A839R157_9MICO|nr:hypothetical protein [Helcobacillus massiliensis]MBB3022196.1 hypothetical protein [Helcobacillus massiliensis]MCT1557272.1 hypothetical protein [Helcobacillus massiliensis]MCT2036249.1 hypothetical protein [Helcobacillus massiliensis]MCT2331557.1 hypothetical protein [Helcobacillus massiliensis]MDK7742158.1 hypothetical protein [Helcobacillus massiliensis]